MRKLHFLSRALLTAALSIIAIAVVVLNWRIYPGNRMEAAAAQLRFLKQSLAEGGGERMQSMFPEGYVFTWALYGLASANIARALPASDARKAEMLLEVAVAIDHVDSAKAKSTFVRDMAPQYGAFYTSWTLYLRSAVLRASASTDTLPFDLAQFERDCDSFASALSRSDTPYLPSYPDAVWPGDTSVGVAALAIADPWFQHRYREVIDKWIGKVRHRLDLKYGAMSHAATVDGQPDGGPRGESLALMSYVLADADPQFAAQQYEILREHFVDYAWGVPGVREYPRGIHGRGDIDSGPLILGFSGPATVVGAGAAIVNGDEAVAEALLAVAETAGFPIEFQGKRRYLGGYLPVGDAFLAWVRTARPATSNATFAPVIPEWWRILFHVTSAFVLILSSYFIRKTIRTSR